jgi:poly-gamma-glutamate synthesis protein (capsule biosynthesis protein)
MCGRGVDQILAHPGDPAVFEPWVRSAEEYVRLAELRSGPVPRRVAASYVWGVTPHVLADHPPAAMIVNLETAVTDRGRPWPGKGIHYRMHPANADVLATGGIDVAVLANNHVMDWSEPGLMQTLDVLRAVGIQTTGAGFDQGEAWRPARVPCAGRDVVVLGVCDAESGVPAEWAAGKRPGVAYLGDLSHRTADTIGGILASAGPGISVASLHWGDNWGYQVTRGRRRFAHRLIDAGVDLVHGHSSHHPIGIEIYRGHLILYGCGDLITDYEGIRGREEYRGDLGGLYLPTLDTTSGELLDLVIAPTQMRRFRIERPEPGDVIWLANVLDRESKSLGTHIEVEERNLRVRW